MNIKVQVSNPTILYQAIFLWCILLFTLGTQVMDTLPRETQQTILNLNIVLAVGFIISRLVAKLKWLMPLFLLGLCFTSGAIVAVLAGSHQLVLVSMGIAVLVSLLAYLLALAPWLRVGKRALIVSLMAFAFSFFGIWWMETYPDIAAGASLLAMFCLFGLLREAFHPIRTGTPAENPLDRAAGLFLLNAGMIINIVIVLFVMS